MAPKLYCFPASPPARAVIMCAKVVGVELECVKVSLLDGDHMRESFLKKCLQHTIPLLKEDDGFTLEDSHAIMPYLVAKYGKDDFLYPKNDLRLRAKIDHLLHFDCGVLFPAANNVSGSMFYQNEKPTVEKLTHLRDAYQITDSIIAANNQKFAVADHVTLADFSLITTLASYATFAPLDDFPNLKGYIERMRKQPWYQYNKDGEEIIRNALEAKLKELA